MKFKHAHGPELMFSVTATDSPSVHEELIWIEFAINDEIVLSTAVDRPNGQPISFFVLSMINETMLMGRHMVEMLDKFDPTNGEVYLRSEIFSGSAQRCGPVSDETFAAMMAVKMGKVAEIGAVEP